jgi:hypothetical protein
VPQLSGPSEHAAPHFTIPPSPSTHLLSPGTLTELLNTLSSRNGGFDSDSHTGNTSPLSTRDYAPDSLGSDLAEEGTDNAIVVHTSSEKPELIKLMLPSIPTKDLKKRIQNVYRAWTDGQDSDGGVQDSQKDFLKFVRDALSEL